MSEIIEVYGCNALSDNIRINSSSGGIFSLVAEYIICSGGVIFGTAMSSDCKLAHFIKVKDIDGIARLRGSKYLQSKVGNTYKQVKEELELGEKVLFSGCPCQVNGLKCFLKKEYENLICIDIICHGVPSPKLWRKYVNYLERRYNGTMIKVDFRSKDIGWREYGIKKLINQSVFFTCKSTDPYMQMFLKDYCLRPSCYECTSKTYRSADISIGDFWGVENIFPELDDEKGTSLVMLRTEKGIQIFNAIKNTIKYKSCEYEVSVKRNSADYKCAVRPSQREQFLIDMNKMSFNKLNKKYLESTFKRDIKKVVKKLFKSKI